jgi:hypothetical protein
MAIPSCDSPSRSLFSSSQFVFPALPPASGLDRIQRMSETQKTDTRPGEGASPVLDAKVVIHRVCISCNNMFKVTANNFTAKHCPKCHKG